MFFVFVFMRFCRLGCSFGKVLGWFGGFVFMWGLVCCVFGDLGRLNSSFVVWFIE